VTPTEFIVACLLVWFAAILSVVVYSWVRSVRSDTVLRGHRVTVHTKQPDDQTIHGVLVRETHDRFVLVDASYITDRGETPIPDRAVVFKASVSWLQEHGEPAGAAKGWAGLGHTVRRLVVE
jgi:hypothetical protein